MLLSQNWETDPRRCIKTYSHYPCHSASSSPPSQTHLRSLWRTLFLLPWLAFNLQAPPFCLCQGPLVPQPSPLSPSLRLHRMPPHQIPTIHHPFKNPNPQIALQLRFSVNDRHIRPLDSALRKKFLSSPQVPSLLVRPPHVHRPGVHFQHRLHHHPETPRR